MSDEPRPMDGNLYLLRELDAVNRRIDGLDQRVTTLDEHGSRGLTGLQVQLTELAKDIATLEASLRQARAGRWQLVGAYIAGLVPIYLFAAQQLLANR